MKKIITSLIVFFCIGVITLPVQASENGVYISAKLMDSIQGTGQSSVDLPPIATTYGFSVDAKNSVGNTFAGSIAMGYDFYTVHNFPLRVELEYTLRGQISDDWSINSATIPVVGDNASLESKWSADTLFANVYYDFYNSTKFTPYVGAGLGLAFQRVEYSPKIAGLSTDIVSLDEAKTTFAWNIGAGCAYAVTDNVSVDFAYRFVSFGEMKSEGSVNLQSVGMGTHDYSAKINPYAHELSLGLRYTF